jgi:hypothetical protein
MNKEIFQIFVDSLSCVIDESGAIYASTPITNGPLLLEHINNKPELLKLAKEDFLAYINQNIIPANVNYARIFVSNLRKIGLGVVIDPSAFFSVSLSQDDYLVLWGNVITRFARAVWFNEGWSFSKGCVTEYCIAVENKIPTFDVIGNKLSPTKALKLVSNAINLYISAGIDIVPLEKQFNRLERHSNQLSA